MKYQSPWWKCVAALLALCVGVKLIAETDVPEKIKLWAQSAGEYISFVSEPSPTATEPPYDDSWLSAESAIPASAVMLQAETPQYGTEILNTDRETKPLNVNNLSDVQPDYDALLEEGWSYSLTAQKPQVLIIHTHTCEAYTGVGEDQYEESDPYRTQDKTKNVVRVGDILAEELTKLGLEVIHDDTFFDYPGYTGSYTRSLEAVEAWLEQEPTLRVVIDLHRDSIGSGYRTEYALPDRKSAQVMLLVTNGESGLYHPAWKENLKLALEIQNEMNVRYEGLARDLCLSPYRYNQHVSPGYMILEVGTDQNTLDEAETAIRLFAECAGKVLKEKVE